MLLISVFHIGQLIDNDDFCPLKTIFIFHTVFLFLQLEQLMAVTDPYFLRMFSPFSRLFFTFSDDKLLLQSLVFAFINGISGCLWFLGTQLHFKNVGCASQACCRFPGCRFPGSQAFSLSVFQQTSPLATRSPLRLLTSRVLCKYSVWF